MSRERALDAVGVQRAKDLKLAGRTYREVASVLGCSVGVVSKAIQGRYDEIPEGAFPVNKEIAGSPIPELLNPLDGNIR